MSIFNGLPKKQLLGGYDQNAAMMGRSGFAPMNEGFAPQQHAMQPAAKKPGPNWAGIASDFLAGMAGQPGQFAAQQQHERAMQQRTQQAEQERMHGREDFLWRQANTRAPERVNDTEQDWNYYKGVLTPAEFETWKQNKINPPRWVGDEYGGGQYVSPSPAPAPVMDISKGLPPGFKIKGGAASNGGNGFR